jgi:thymidine kinase
MFLEPHIDAEKNGWIEVICGSMFSGKTEELLRRLKRARIANKSIIVFKPKTDTRYHETNIMSHDDNSTISIPINNSKDIIEAVNDDIEVVAIDEAQFFDENLPEICSKLASNGKRVIIAGLDMDYLGKPFGPMPYLLSMAEYITKLHAICVVCGGTAQLSYRKHNESGSQLLLGAKDIYEARCRKCFTLKK